MANYEDGRIGCIHCRLPKEPWVLVCKCCGGTQYSSRDPWLEKPKTCLSVRMIGLKEIENEV